MQRPNTHSSMYRTQQKRRRKNNISWIHRRATFPARFPLFPWFNLTCTAVTSLQRRWQCVCAYVCSRFYFLEFKFQPDRTYSPAQTQPPAHSTAHHYLDGLENMSTIIGPVIICCAMRCEVDVKFLRSHYADGKPAFTWNLRKGWSDVARASGTGRENPKNFPGVRACVRACVLAYSLIA